MILELCWKKSRKPTFQCLNLVNGQKPEWYEAINVKSLGESSTLNTGESPNAVKESFLSQILEDNPPEKYYLSQTAVIGILRRAMRRGKRLPVELEKALIYQSLGGDVNGEETIRAACEILSVLREEIGAENFAEWVSRIYLLVQSEKVLQYSMSTQGDNEAPAGFEPENTKRSEAQGKCDLSIGSLCRLWEGLQDRCASYRRERVQQLTREFSEIVQKLSCEKAHTPTILYCLREASEREGASAGAESGVGAAVVRMRAGKPGGGKGALVSRERSLTLAANANDQILFAAGFKHKASGTAGSIGYQKERAVVAYDMTHADEVMHPVTGNKSNCLNGRMGTGGNQVPVVHTFADKASMLRAGAGEIKHQADAEGRLVAHYIAGNTIDRKIQNGGNGKGVLEETSYTLNTVDRHAVFTQQAIGQYKETGKASSIKSRDYKSATDLVAVVDCRNGNEGAINGTLQAKPNGGTSLNLQNVVRVHIRRLTLTEIERLQGLPDNYTLIDDKSCSDTARYKALGNGMAQPCADWVIQRIEKMALGVGK